MTIKVPRLCIHDLHDGTGATAQVLDSSAGTTNTIYSFPFGGLTTSIAVTNHGTIDHDGDLALSLDPGSYYGYLVSTLDSDTATSGLVSFSVTSDGDTLDRAEEAAEAIRQHVQGLGLPNLPTRKVLMRKLPLRTYQQLGNIGVGALACPVTETRTPGASFAEDQIVYRTQLSLVRAGNQSLTDNLREDLIWRERILDTLMGLPPAGATGAYLAQATPGPVIEPSAFEAQVDLGTITIGLTSMESHREA